MKSFLHYTLIFILIILSFLCYSSNFYTLLTSDDAIQVLMIHNFQLPHDLYFWGQDRYGSLIPMLGQIFYKGLGFSPLTSESLPFINCRLLCFCYIFQIKIQQAHSCNRMVFPAFKGYWSVKAKHRGRIQPAGNQLLLSQYPKQQLFTKKQT